MEQLSENRESLWILTISPAIWAGHFLLSYVTAAVWCAKVAGKDGSLLGARVAIAAFTAAALAGIAATGWRALRRHRSGGAATPYDFDSTEDRHGFLGLATLLLSVLSAVAVVFAALTIIFFQSCQ